MNANSAYLERLVKNLNGHTAILPNTEHDQAIMRIRILCIIFLYVAGMSSLTAIHRTRSPQSRMGWLF
jgi:hypothetical protein